MTATKRFLIVINRTDETQYVLDKAATLASAEQATVQVVRIIHNELVDFVHTPHDEAQRLKLFIMETEHDFLDDLMDFLALFALVFVKGHGTLIIAERYFCQIWQTAA